MSDIKTWQERFPRDLMGKPSPAEIDKAKDAEIAELRAALAARATPAQPVLELTPLDYRAQGREEVLAIILSEDPENPFNDYTDSQRDHSGEYNTFWLEKELRELLHIGDRKHDAYDRAEAQYWEAVGCTDEAKRAQAFAENMHGSGKVRAALEKHGEYDLIAELCTATPAQATPSQADIDMPSIVKRLEDACQDMGDAKLLGIAKAGVQSVINDISGAIKRVQVTPSAKRYTSAELVSEALAAGGVDLGTKPDRVTPAMLEHATPEGGQDLPPLPGIPGGYSRKSAYDPYGGKPLYTADQMRDYARAALAQKGGAA